MITDDLVLNSDLLFHYLHENLLVDVIALCLYPVYLRQLNLRVFKEGAASAMKVSSFCG